MALHCSSAYITHTRIYTYACICVIYIYIYIYREREMRVMQTSRPAYITCIRDTTCHAMSCMRYVHHKNAEDALHCNQLHRIALGMRAHKCIHDTPVHTSHKIAPHHINQRQSTRSIICVHIYMYMYICVCMYIYLYMCVCLCIHV